MTVLLTLFLNSCFAGEFAEKVFTAVAQENAPWRGAPLVFLTDEDDGRSCGRAMEELLFHASAHAPHLLMDAEYFRNVADLFPYLGVPQGYFGSDRETAFEQFLRTEPRGTFMVASHGNDWGASLVGAWLGKTLIKGQHVTSKGTFSVAGLTGIFDLGLHTRLAEDLPIADLLRHTVTSGTLHGCTFHVVNRLRAQAQLGCHAILKAP